MVVAVVVGPKRSLLIAEIRGKVKVDVLVKWTGAIVKKCITPSLRHLSHTCLPLPVHGKIFEGEK